MDERKEFEAWFNNPDNADPDKVYILPIEAEQEIRRMVKDISLRAWEYRAALAAQPATQGPTMNDAIAAGDGTLHGAIDHWQTRALEAERKLSTSVEPSDEEAAKFADQYGMYYDQDTSIAGAHARALLSRYGRPAGDAQPVAAQETYPQMMPAELSQFLSDVMTAAGLVSHGKQCKALGERLGDACMRLRRHYQEPFAAPVAAQNAGDARDAERYRFIRDTPWLGTELERVIGLQKNGLWDAAIDAAIAQQRKGE